MKIKKQNKNRSIHQNIEYFCRNRFALYLICSLMLLGLVKIDSAVVSIMRQAYAHGLGFIGAYMREETTRMPVDFGAGAKIITNSGR